MPFSEEFLVHRRRGTNGLVGEPQSVPAESVWACGTTHTPADASYAAVAAKVALAENGDCVVVPAGTAIWSSTLNITKAIQLKGAGIGQTVITSNLASGSPTYLVTYSPSGTALTSDLPFRISGFTFDCDWKGGCIGLSNSDATRRLTQVRVDHCRIIEAGGGSGSNYAIRVTGEVCGVADSNQFVDCRLGTQILGNETSSWNNFPLQAGTKFYWYIEDNTYQYTGAQTDLAFCAESGQGGRYVWRYNTVTTDVTGLTGALEILDIHGNQSDYPTDRGTLGVELYNNTLTLRGTFRAMNLRGGDAKMFNNTATQIGGASTLEMTEYDNWSYGIKTTYPGFDPVQNAFYWNNLRDGSTWSPFVANPPEDDVMIQLDRDYFLPSSGLEASRPASGTYYGATDTGKLFQYSGGVWATLYTPYTYPHPLTV